MSSHRQVKRTIRLEQWIPMFNAYSAPEVRYLHGYVPGRGLVRTSPVVDVKGNVVKTHSGSLYCLGTPHADYMKWLRNHGKVFSDKQPLAGLGL